MSTLPVGVHGGASMPRQERGGTRAAAGPQPASLPPNERRPAPAPHAPAATTRPLLVIGGTGRTGRRALEGLLAAGVAPEDICLLSSRPTSPGHADLLARGLEVIGADLDNEASLCAALGDGSTSDSSGSTGASSGRRAVYIHALSADGASATPAELERARRLADALAGGGVTHVVYNSSAGRGCDAGISQVQMEQKHEVEDILVAAGLPFTALQATLFMEELWKKHTRPAILSGTFSFAVPKDMPMQMVSVKDMGRVAAQVVQQPEEFIGRAVPLAGDALTPEQMAAAFGAAQSHQPEVHYRRLPAWPFWLFNRDLYRICRYYSTKGYGVDVEACRSRFGLQDFASFLEETRWGDANMPVL